MRSDMHKVLCERPRSGGAKRKDGPHKGFYKSQRIRFAKDVEVPIEVGVGMAEDYVEDYSWMDLPIVESMKKSHQGHHKDLNENLNPLYRWLKSNIGRPWNTVYSEACAVIDTNSAVRNHIKVHMLQMVERHTFLENGEVYYCDDFSFRGQGIRKITEKSGGMWDGFYVCPQTGYLAMVPKKKYKQTSKEEEIRRVLTPTEELRKVKNIWYRVHVLPNWPDLPGVYADKLGEHRPNEYILSSGKWIVRHGIKDVRTFVTDKRQLSSKELKNYGLKNG